MGRPLRVALAGPLRELYTYEVPPLLLDRLGGDPLGWRLVVPLGTRRVIGIGVEWDSDPPATLRPVLEVVDDRPLLSPALWRLTQWVASYYCCDLGVALRAVLPAPMLKVASRHRGLRRDRRIALRRDLDEEALDLAVGRSRRRRDLVEVLRAAPEGRSMADLRASFPRAAALVRALRERGVIEESIAFHVEPAPPRSLPLVEPPPESTDLTLNPDQARALEALRRLGELPRGAPDSRVLLLEGVTGSGKTEVYMRAVAETLEAGRQAIILVPEIGLTPQVMGHVDRRFGGAAALLHSGLTEAQRVAAWWRLRRGDARIALGPRSALFAPLDRLGLIVVDEEHESSYKQDGAPPYYNGRDLAIVRARLEGASCLLVTATPALETYAAAQRGAIHRVVLGARVARRPMPRVELLDLRRQAKTPMASPNLSARLVGALRRCVEAGGQAILLANRRGYAQALHCPACGATPTCSHCDASLRYHRFDETLRCHLCGASRPAPSACPRCGHGELRPLGAAVERVEAEVRDQLPHLRVDRMDSDTARAGRPHHEVLQRLAAGEIDVLVGTQLVAKGHDVARVTLVGVVLADAALYLPDFRAAERTFQLLTQAAGRAGRGTQPGEVLIQTYQPDHYALRCAAKQEYQTLAARELPLREELGLPPSRRLALVTLRDEGEERAAALAAEVARALGLLLGLGPAYDVRGPWPAPLFRVNDRYRYQVVVRGPREASLGPRIRYCLDRAGLTPARLRRRVVVDVDPLSVL